MARITFTVEERESVLSSLTRVGRTKAVGYLPLQTISKFLDMKVEDVVANARARGLVSLVLSPEECCVKSGAIYVYDPTALDDILKISAITLVRAGFPTSPEAFIRAIARDWLELEHCLIPVIRAAFADEL